jgi:hypothetical protein
MLLKGLLAESTMALKAGPPKRSPLPKYSRTVPFCQSDGRHQHLPIHMVMGAAPSVRAARSCVCLKNFDGGHFIEARLRITIRKSIAWT